MVVTGLGLLLGQRADSGAVRSGAAQASVDGVWIVPEDGPVAERVREAGGIVEPLGDGTAELFVGRSVSSEGRGRATVGGRAAPAGVLADLADELVVVHGQSDQLRLRSATAQRDALDRFGGDDGAVRPRRVPRRVRAVAGDRARAHRAHDRPRRPRGRGRAAARSSSPRSSRPRRSPARTPSSPSRAERLANAEELRLAAADRARRALGRRRGARRRGAPGRGAPRARARARPRPDRPGRAGGRPRLSRGGPRRRAGGLPRRSRRDRPARARRRRGAPRGAHRARPRARHARRRRSRCWTPARRGSPSSTTTATGSSGSPRSGMPRHPLSTPPPPR